MNDDRRNPELLLKQVQEEDRLKKRGKLKIYLGAAPGVGKTYMMLNDANGQRAKGLDVVIGIVETHGRKETESLASGLEILPRQQVMYRGKELVEFDLEGALKRNPSIILLDEMAHTNAPGLLHEKRWQDIKELLDRGVDVYTTLNVQHIESLNDVVSQIIHKRIMETVPDSMLEMADSIELVDLPPEDLLKRLQEGKVYFPQQAELAAEQFFRKGNLIALRELALRITAERVGAQVLLYRQGLGIRHVWPTKEKILVCVGPGPESIRLIRTARRLAASLQAEWAAVHIDAPRLHYSEMQRNAAIQNLHLAEQLGAEIRIIPGLDLVKEIVDFAREKNITTVVVGRQVRSRFQELFYQNLADELVRYSHEIDVHIVTCESEPLKHSRPTAEHKGFDWGIYWIATGIIALGSIINTFLYPYVGASTLIMLYLVCVTLVALMGKSGPCIFASFLSVAAYGFFFVPPFYTFPFSDIQYLVTLMTMLLVSQIISQLTIAVRRQAEVAKLAEHRTEALHSLSRQLAGSRGVDKLLEIALRQIGQAFNCEVIALLPEGGRLIVKSRYKSEEVLNEKELGVAQWVFELGQPAGLGTDTLPFSTAMYLPLLTSQQALGVLMVKPIKSGRLFTPEQMRLLDSYASQIALAIEVDRLQEQSQQSEIKMETDRVRSTLLHAVSHDLRQPLVSMMGSATTLMEIGDHLEKIKIKKLGKEIYLELEQLSRLINNLLQITYLEAESVKLQKQPGSIGDLINFVVSESRKKLRKRVIQVNIPDFLPEVPFDYTLIQEVLMNLLDNALKFTPPQTPIDINVVVEDDRVIVSVEDQGPGIMPDEVNKLFEKFYRGRLLTAERGLGLGLAICHSVIKAHGGEIWAENRIEGGAIFRFSLPFQSNDDTSPIN